MIVGITGPAGSGKTEVSKFLSNKYGFKHIEVDKIVESYIKEGRLSTINQYLSDNFNVNVNQDIDIAESFFKNSIDAYLMDTNFKREIDNIILAEIKKNPQQNIIIDWLFLEQSALFKKCNILIKTEADYDLRKKRYIERNGSIDMNKFCNINNVFDDNLKDEYHKILDTNHAWQKDIADFIDLNAFGKNKISVIVPIYNAEQFLNRSVGSIQKQSYQNLEIILVNDGSTDDSQIVCEELAKKDNRIKVINQPNGGLSNARNTGLSVATGDYVGFVDADDYINNNMYSSLLKNSLDYSADISCGHAFVHSRDGKIVNLSDEDRIVTTPATRKDILDSHLNGMVTTAVWDKLFKREAISDIRFDENLFNEDAGFMLDVCLNSNSFVCDSEQYYHYIKRRGTSLTGRKFDSRFFTTEQWGEEAYNRIIALGDKYKDAAEKFLFNSLAHVLKTYMRDYKSSILDNYYFDEMQDLVNKIINLLFATEDVSKFKDLDNVLGIIEQLLNDNIITQERLPKMELPCIGILWNSLEGDLMTEAIQMLSTRAKIEDITFVDLGSDYRPFINEIYLYNNEKIGVTVFKANVLIDRYDSNTIAILKMNIDVSNFVHYSKKKGYMYKEIAEIKDWIRGYFMNKIDEYAFDNVFRLTVDMDEYEFTDQVCKKYVQKGHQYSKGSLTRRVQK